ncbi:MULTISPECIES: tetratricopeptide repeat protein [unclassified Xanthomonas]|uniref:tetratricopeptide repeat protein n=1 Tax=unclassified Xanthomonas TaxID=2643310 RepID=UPI00136CA0D6|nr:MULTISPECIES: tetratricopeptide repeat protein [unclassified Xanthomonas]MBB5943502.1 hypothetical protein [Xanthomonas sp. 3307]
MSFVPAECPSCLKIIQVPIDVEISKCMYCGEEVSRPHVLVTATTPSLSNLLGMARTASLAGNFGEAESYYNRVLEIEPRSAEAWIGKGKSAAWQSSIANIRTNEMAVAFNNAIGASDNEGRSSIVESCVQEMNHIVAMLYGMANKQMQEYVALDSTWNSYISQVAQLLGGLESALAWDPNNVTTLENIVHLCKDNIEGVTYRDPYDSNIQKVWSLSPAYEQTLRGQLDAANEKLKSLNPSYVAPSIEKKKLDSCFVVTATMGDEKHPAVTLLRQFRAEFLSGTSTGEAFIRWYYRNGPKIARVINASDLCRVVSYIIVVTPAAFIAYFVLLLRRK